ncbi:hypothetical protein [Streptomyces pseudovenezuelae]|uniref:Sugar phosphate isomerase n=1 Tax=Streptomyces pseudovenezuelae TaxID=67350 RepID=A0ABT6LB54_9ACTN|nr:hypothetical protein [Streptomyces pseudovenezuelae]MDH6213547.1 hypothetical protein [Streptomyces pseudovenezuelae]
MRESGLRCYQHLGRAALPDPGSGPRPGTTSDRSPGRVPPAVAAWCAELLDEPALDVISAHAAEYATERVWRDLVKHHRRPGGCDDLAAAARELLDMRKTVRDSLTAMMPRAHRDGFVVAFIGEALSRLVTLPLESQLAVAARGLQIAGICVCVLSGDLDNCACLEDVLKSEGEEQVKALVTGAMEDWRDLPRRMGDTP